MLVVIMESLEDNFKPLFKYYKSNRPKPSLNDVVSIENKCAVDKVVPMLPDYDKTDERAEYLGLKPLKEWKLFAFVNHPGLLLIRNPFTCVGQRYWIKRCLEEYPKKPNKTNIDIEMHVKDWWTECHISKENNRELEKKLRWVTLGYQHDWDTKVYREDNKTTFPDDLAELSDIVAGYLSYRGFKAEAAIVNYYHMGSTLSAHTDHSEINLAAPLLSFSFGQSAIFLIGGKDKTTIPTAILIQSGDIMIMSKEARLCFHAVPKIMKTFHEPWNEKGTKSRSIKQLLPSFKFFQDSSCVVNSDIKDVEWNNFKSYVQVSRINMNVRQVLNEEQDKIA